MRKKYNDKKYIESYAGIWSFGYLNGIGNSEGFYRTINDLIAEIVIKNKLQESKILEVGFGVGRILLGVLSKFPQIKIDAVEKSQEMINMAKKILLYKKEIKLDLRDRGFGYLKIKGFNIKTDNLNFYKNSIEKLRGKLNKYDLILSINTIDRVSDVEKFIKKISKLLKQDGFLILSSPLNFLSKKIWGENNNLNNYLKEIFLENDLKTNLFFDNLVYEEILDKRGSRECYNNCLWVLKKK